MMPGCQRTSCPADQGSQQVRTTRSRPCTDCGCEYSVAAASPLPSRACADCLLWPKQHTQRSNSGKLTRVHYSPPVGLASIYTHSVCVCVCVCVLCGTQDVSSRPGIEPVPPAMDVQSANHWTTWEVPACISF